ncbi:MAG: hypothetical protein WCN95_12880 [bacterium]
MVMTEIDQDVELLNNIRTRMPELKRLLHVRHSHCHYVDQMFHFYHRSWRVYYLQDETRHIVEVLGSLGPKGTKFCQEFEDIIQQGTNVKKLDFEQVIQQVLDGRDAERAYNKQWTAYARPIVEAFLHARFFLEMAVSFGKQLEEAPELVPPGWAALLCLYDLR